jgi:adenylate cyclase
MAGAVAEAAPIGATRGPAKTQLRRFLYGLLVLLLLGALCAPFFTELIAQNAPRVRGGVADYSRWGPLDQPVEIAGDWAFTWRAGKSGPPPGTRMTVAVPGLWEGTPVPGGGTLPMSGLATYEVTLTGVPAGSYLIHFPNIFAANQVWINGRMMSSRGRIGTSAETTRYFVRAHDISFETDGRPVHIRLDAAAFLHRDNGLEEPPVFGLEEPMRTWIALKWSREFLYNIALLLIAALGIAVYLFRRRDKAPLFFGLSCLFFIPSASVFGYDNLLLLTFPGLSFQAMLAIQYLPGAFAIAFFFLNAHTLFPNESSPRAARVILALFGIVLGLHVALLLLNQTVLSSRVQQVFMLGIVFPVLVYMLVIVGRATMRGRPGAAMFLTGLFFFITTFMIGAIVASGGLTKDQVILYEYTAMGILMLLFSHVVIMAERWAVAIQDAEQTSDELRRLLEVNTAITTEMQLGALLKKIVQVTSKIVHAERSSLFLHDPRTDELSSLVAEGVDTREIRFPAQAGLAGHSFTTGEVINITDAYQDPRFNREIDAQTGFRTRSLLTLPIVARDGRRLGVMQSLNHVGGHFTDGDVARMGAFAAQAAVAIDNATLFSEVVSARNYNESILRSMSSGVITLDREARIAKLNTAACRILGIAAEDVGGTDIRAVLAAGNPWLIEEIDAVGSSGEAKNLLDVDLATSRGDTVSANITIVPLLSDNERVGTLILIEDISEGKRLQGAMRRFMTQKVVDQVLGRGDDLLFGTSCEASVLFADIRGFTSLAETLAPRETVDMLNEIFTELFEAVAASDGVLDKFIGDAIMAVYGAPLSTGRDPQNAVESAVQMLRMLEGLNQRRRERQLPDLKLGVGIATGDVVAGTIGSPKRMDYTVIGDSVNLAARLQDITKRYQVGIILDETTAGQVNGTHPLRELDLIQVRGRRRPEKIFQVLTQNGAFANGEAVLAAYAQGRSHMLKREWKQAAFAFGEAIALNPADRPSALMLERTRILMNNPPPPDWSGVWQAQE